MMDSLYNEILNEVKEDIANDFDVKSLYYDGTRIIWKRDYEEFFNKHIKSQFLYYALESAKDLILSDSNDFISSILNKASAIEILKLSEALQFDQQWGRKAYTRFFNKKTRRAHELGFKAYKILRIASEIAYTDAAMEVLSELGIEAY